MAEPENDRPKRKRNRIPGVFKRGGKWYYKVSVIAADGRYKQVWRGGFDNQHDADVERTEALARRNSGIDINPKRLTVEQYLRRWLKDYAQALKPKTHAGYESLFRNHVIPVIGSLLLSRLKPMQVQMVYSTMREHGRSEKTIFNCHRALSEALRHAVKWEVTIRNPAEPVAPPPPPDYQHVVLTHSQIHDVLRITDDSSRGVIMRFAIYSGLRQGELLRLRWSDIDFGRNLVSIPVAKSRAGERALVLSADAIEILRQHRYRQLAGKFEVGPGYKDEGLVFTREDGTPLSAGIVDRAWDKLRKAIGTAARFHDLRHTNASILLAAGVPMKVVQERLGHANFQVTANTYSHLIPGLELSENAAKRFDALLQNEASSSLVAEVNEDGVKWAQ